MKKRIQYRIEVKFDRISNLTSCTYDLEYYSCGAYRDKLKIEPNSFELLCARSSYNKKDYILENTQNSIHSNTVRAILSVVLLAKVKPQIKELTIYEDGTALKTLKPEEIHLPIISDEFMLHLGSLPSLNFDAFVPYLFSTTKKAHQLTVALISYMISFRHTGSDKFFRLWRAFNSIYTVLSSKKQEKDKIIDFRHWVLNQTNFKYSCNRVSKFKTHDIRKLRIREMILSDFPDAKRTRKEYKAFVERQTSDARLSQVLLDTLPYRQPFLATPEVVQIKAMLNASITANKNSDIHLVLFIILRYAYFFRNKLFHGESLETDVSFYAKADERTRKEIEAINAILQIFVLEMFSRTL